MTAVPDWATAFDCPVNDCDGEYFRDVTGSAANPIMEYPSTCNHNINTCHGCNEKKAIKRKFSWPVEGVHPASPGKTMVKRFCADCSDPATIEEIIPDWVFERG